MNAESSYPPETTVIGSEADQPWIALSSYITSHKDELLRACRSISVSLHITDDGDTAEIGLEIFSEMTLQARATAMRYDPTRPAGPWLRKIALRAAQRRAEQEGLRRANEVPLELTVESLFDMAPSPEEKMQEWASVEALLSPLSSEARALVLKIAVEDWDMKQVGETLGISAATARQRYHRALCILRNSPIVQKWANARFKEQSK